MAMWANFFQFVPPQGIAVGALKTRLGVDTKELVFWLTRMGKWWRYLNVGPDKVVRPTPGGLKAIEVWRPLTATIEERWEKRFGKAGVDRLRAALREAGGLPCEYLPILGYGLSAGPAGKRGRSANPTLASLLSGVLLAFAREFEADAPVSLAISANVLHLAGDDPVPARHIPRLAGISKEATAMALSFLQKQGYAAPGKTLSLTDKGQLAKEVYRRTIRTIEERWQKHELRESLEWLAGEDLFRGLEPYPDNWRAKVPRPEVLPNYPMVLHRGGYPDGS